MVRKYRNRASELGFYNEEKDQVEMGKFVETALNFYITQAPKLNELQMNNMANSVLVQVLKDNVRVQQINMIKVAALLERLVKQNPQLKELLTPALRLLPDVPKQALQGGEKLARQQES